MNYSMPHTFFYFLLFSLVLSSAHNDKLRGRGNDDGNFVSLGGLELRDVLVVAGNYTMNGKFTNIAMYDLLSGT